MSMSICRRVKLALTHLFMCMRRGRTDATSIFQRRSISYACVILDPRNILCLEKRAADGSSFFDRMIRYSYHKKQWGNTVFSNTEKAYPVYKPHVPLYNKQKVWNQYSSIDILFDSFYQKECEGTNSLLMWVYFKSYGECTCISIERGAVTWPRK